MLRKETFLFDVRDKTFALFPSSLVSFFIIIILNDFSTVSARYNLKPTRLSGGAVNKIYKRDHQRPERANSNSRDERGARRSTRANDTHSNTADRLLNYSRLVPFGPTGVPGSK